ncbi:MAG: cation transporter [Oscillospiraceae bacterium]|nr:cation transporter [Oscillospiraceae bacterium]
MVKITMHVEGMMCPHCEAHMNDAIKVAFDVKKVTSSHADKMTEIISKEPISEEEIKNAVKETGYSVSDIKIEEYKKFSLFGR